MSENLDDKQILIFRVGPVVCCVDSHLVESIVHPQPLHRFPHQADFILGVLQYQNSAVSVVNLFHKFELPDPNPTAESRYVMAHTAKGSAGFWVDEVLEVTDQFEIHSTKPPEYSEQCVFESTILWRDKLILKTDFTQLFTMNDAGPLQEWIRSDASNAIAKNYPNSTIEESDITAWTESINEASDEKIQALESRGVEFSQMVSFDTDDSIETIIGDEPNFDSINEEAMTVSPLTDLSIVSVSEVTEKKDPESSLKVEIEPEKENVETEITNSESNIEQLESSSEDNKVMKALADQYGDSLDHQTTVENPEMTTVDPTEITEERAQTIADKSSQASSTLSDENVQNEVVNLTKVDNVVENSKMSTLTESHESNISEKVDIDTNKPIDNNISIIEEVKSQAPSELAISDNINIDDLYDQSDIPLIEDDVSIAAENNESNIPSEQDIPASLIEGIDDTPNTLDGSSIDSTNESKTINKIDSIANTEEIAKSTIQLSESEESVNVQKTSTDSKSEIQNVIEDDEVIEALANQHNDSQDYQKSDLKIGVEKLDTTEISVKDNPTIQENLQRVSITNQESFSARESKILLDHEINFELPNESKQDTSDDSSIFAGSDFKIENTTESSDNLSPDGLIDTSIEHSTSISAQIEGNTENQQHADVTVADSNSEILVDDQSSTESIQVIESRIEDSIIEDSSILNAENSISDYSVDISVSETLDENNVESSIDLSDIEVTVEDSAGQVSEYDKMSNISKPYTDTLKDSGSVEKLSSSISESSQSELIVDAESVPLKKESTQKENQSTVIQKADKDLPEHQAVTSPKIDTHETVDDFKPSKEVDEEKNAAKALAAQYGDIDYKTTKTNENVSAQNQIKQSQPELFEHYEATSAHTANDSSKVINDPSSATLIRPDFVEQSKADELTLSFISQDLTDTEINVDIEPLTNLYTEFLGEVDEVDSTELLLTRSNSDIEDTSKRGSIVLNEARYHVEQPSSISDTSVSVELDTSHITHEQSKFSESGTTSVISATGNFDDTVVVNSDARKFKEDVETFFEKNIKDRVETYNQGEESLSDNVLDLDEPLEPRDEFLDSIDDKLDEDKELHVTQDKAVGKIIERIERNRDGKDKTSPARVVASILICAITVFAIQHYWLNPTEEEIQVASLELLIESAIETPIEAPQVFNDETKSNQVSEKEIEVFNETIAEPQERYTEIPSNAIGGVDAKNAVSNENLESVFNWKKHIIIRGDTLWALSERYLNDPFRYPDLARWSNIKNPDKIYPGNEVSYNTSKEAKNL